MNTKHNIRKLGMALQLSLTILASTDVASAATRKVVFKLVLADNRTNCATPAEAGARRPCDDGNNVAAFGHIIELWDKDDFSDDERIGSWIIGTEGTSSITFEWEGASYSKGETDPDVYVKYINKVRKSDLTGARVTAVDTDGSAHPIVSWRSVAVAENCAAGVDCEMAAGNLIPTLDPTTELGQRVLALDSSQHTLEVLGEAMDLDVEMFYPGNNPSTSYADSQVAYHIRETKADEGMVPTHELGHVIQMQQFGQDFLRDDCSLGGGTHWLNIGEYESCATTEGWADYVAAVSWYEPNNVSTVPIVWGFDVEEPIPVDSTCADNGGIELQVAKAFWDLDDWNDESGAGSAAGKDDNDRFRTLWMARSWGQFPDGTNDREDYETGRHGVNVKDYYFNNEGRPASTTWGETLRGHNCLQFQQKY